MEVFIAAGGAAVLSAASAAINDRPELKQRLQDGLRRLSTLSGLAPPTADAALLASLHGLNLSYDATRQSLDGSRRGLQTAELVKLAGGLAGTPPGTLLKLNLSHTPLSAEAVNALCRAHEAMANLSTLRLRGCALGDAGAAALCAALHHPDAAASGRLTELALASNGLGPSSASALAAAVRELPQLLSLDLSYNPLGSEACITLADAIADAGLLRTLSLASVGLDDAGVVSLASALSAAPLDEIDLDSNLAGDGGLGALLGMSVSSGTLSTLRLCANRVGATGALALAAHLQARPNGPLRSVALSNNELGGKAAAALLKAVEANASLADVGLQGTGISAAQKEQLAAHLVRNRQAQRKQARIHTKSLLRAASEQLASDNDSGAAAAAATAGRGGADEAGARAPSAAAAGGGGGGISAGGAASSESVAASPARPPPRTPTAEAAATPRDGVGTPASQRGYSPLVPTSYSCGTATPYSAGGLGSSASAVGLDAEGLFGPTGDLSAGVVRQRRELFILPSARQVLLDGAGLCDEHMDELADYMRDNSGTELLQLSRNDFTDGAIDTLSDALRTCAVRRLSVAGNNIESGGACSLADALSAGFAPSHLDLSDNMVDDEGALTLVEAAVAASAAAARARAAAAAEAPPKPADGADSGASEEAERPGLRWLDLRLNPLSDAGMRAAQEAASGAPFELLL